MTLEDQITALLAEAEPLRCLPIDEQSTLAAIVDEINRLRALQARAIDAHHEAELAGIIAELAPTPVKRGPGRPKKAD